MKSQGKLIEEFQDGATRGSASNMFIEGDVLYSYGRHFPLAIRFDNDDARQYLINADKYSVTTGCHQHAVFHLGPQVPFSALQAAGIVPDYVEILDAKESQWHHVPDPTPEEPERERLEHTLGGVVLGYRDKLYLSSLDDNEPWYIRSYFLCELPREASTIEDAYDSLVPEKVKQWREGAVNSQEFRQGEWFFLPSDVDTRSLPRPTYHHARLLDTDHYVTELRVDGDLFSRGTVRHSPERRRSQHRMLGLGKKWHVTVKNLAVNSWNANGGVD